MHAHPINRREHLFICFVIETKLEEDDSRVKDGSKGKHMLHDNKYTQQI